MKRAFDFSIATILLIALAPTLALVAILIWLKLGRPILFGQARPGKDSVPFKMIKFRSMLDKRDQNGVLLDDSDRLTDFGKFLRQTSLDELPELWNVIKGEMSLVGPRPLLIDYLPLYNAEQARRHKVRPGITGWAQVNGRNAISWEEKFALDVWYVDNHNIWLDLKIIWLTIRKVVARDGISASGEATMRKFTGEKK